MKPFKFLLNPFLDHQQDMVVYEEGWESGDGDNQNNREHYWRDICPYEIGTREHEMWGQGYTDRFHIINYRMPRL